MDLPDAPDKLAELEEQLEKPHGKVAALLIFYVVSSFFNYVVYCKTVEV